MRLFRITVPQYVYNRLPVRKRTPVRVAFFQRLFTPFAVLMNEWINWRDRANTALRVTGETLSLQWYLNSLFDPTDRRIEIESAGLSGVNAGYEVTQNAYFMAAGVEGVQSGVAVGLPGQDVVYGNVSFVVKVPYVVYVTQLYAVSHVVKTYKAGGKSFAIIQI